MADRVWFKNGKVIMLGGKVILCDHCPCEPCTLHIYVSGWDHDRSDIGQPTHHVFKIKLKDVSIKDVGFSYGSIVDLGGRITRDGSSSFTVELDNRGSSSDDSYDFTIDLTLYAGAKVEDGDVSITHSFSGSAGSSEFTRELTGDCVEDEEEDFE